MIEIVKPWDSIYLNDYRFDFKKLRNESRKT